MRKFVIFGLGKSGTATVDFLLQKKFSVIASDDSEQSLENLKKQFNNNPNLQTCKEVQNIIWTGAEYLILSPGVPLTHPKPHQIVLEANKNNIKIICDVELFYQFHQNYHYIGITGTNGKSTTTTLTHHIFETNNIKNQIGGNIGIPSFELKESDNYILELSSYQLDLVEKSHFNIASIINISPDHLDRHGNMTNYIRSKKRIFLNQGAKDYALLNIDDDYCRIIFDDLKNNPSFKANLVPISTTKTVANGISIIGNTLHNQIDGNSSKLSINFPESLKGEHNAQNTAFSFANAFLSGIAESNIVKAIENFGGLRHRMQFVKKIGNINFINDSKGTNAIATKNALNSYDNIYWILGGTAKEEGIKPLEPYFNKINKAFIIGNSQEQFANFLENKVQYHKCENLDKAFKMAHEEAKKDNKEVNILLSPACSSFDQWKNFEERGDFFCKLVENVV